MAFHDVVKTYNSRLVKVEFDGSTITGMADDTFVTIEQKGNGVISKSGVDGEVARAVDPNEQFTVRFVLLQTSASNDWLQSHYQEDITTGHGLGTLTITDMRGENVFFATAAWVSKQPTRTYGKDTVNREWTFETGPAKMSFDTYYNRGRYSNSNSVYAG